MSGSNVIVAARLLGIANPNAARVVAERLRNHAQVFLLVAESAVDPDAVDHVRQLCDLADALGGRAMPPTVPPTP